MCIQFNKLNFHKHTFCEFREVSKQEIEKLKLSFSSKSGSQYYFTENGVYRVSNHWGRAANCRWRLLSNEKKVNQHKRIGYANWIDFYPNNETERLFYVAVNWENKTVTFQHKNNPNFKEEYYLRTAKEVAKVVKECKTILESDSWAKYLNYSDLEKTKKEIINELICTNKTLIEVKSKFL